MKREDDVPPALMLRGVTILLPEVVSLCTAFLPPHATLTQHRTKFFSTRQFGSSVPVFWLDKICHGLRLFIAVVVVAMVIIVLIWRSDIVHSVYTSALDAALERSLTGQLLIPH
jgi:hypothetical protein